MVSAAVVAAALACTPHQGLGTVTYALDAMQHVLDLATCRETVRPAPRPHLAATPGLSVTARRHGKKGVQSIVLDGRVVLTVRESYATTTTGSTSAGPCGASGSTARSGS